MNIFLIEASTVGKTVLVSIRIGIHFSNLIILVIKLLLLLVQ